jgi:class 3 adenylate cyclase
LSRLTPFDKALLWILVPLWVVCFSLGVWTQIEGGRIAFIGLSVADADSYPALTGEFASGYSSDPLADAGLRAGDLLVRVGETDLRGVGTQLAFRSIVDRLPGRELDVHVLYERNGERRETALGLVPASLLLPSLAASLSFAAAAVFVLLRARPTRLVHAFFLAAFCSAFAVSYFGGGDLVYASAWIYIIANGLVFPLWLRVVQVFPNDVAPEGRMQRSWPWLFSVFGLFHFLYIVAGRFTIGRAGVSATSALALTALLALFTYKYQRLDLVARRQMKWVLLGVYGALLPIAAANAIALVEPRLTFLAYLSIWAVPIFPAALAVSVARFNLFDIDRLLSAAASYNILAVLLGAGAIVVVPRIAEAVSGVVGIDPGAGQVVLALLLAGVVVPAHRRLRPQIDRVFFKERYALDQGVAELLPALSQCPDARTLTQRVGEGLSHLLRPEACVVYARVEQTYAPAFVEGRAVPPAFAAGSSLIVALLERRTPLALSDEGRRPDEAVLTPFDRAALETLGAEVVVPVRQDGALAAFLCLGPKQSGDVYTSTDLSLLATVAEKVSTELRRFAQDEVVREAREMQESLRRYVPGAIAEQLSTGSELISGEREVSVLFVDIRGYTSLSENRKADEIFSTVNRYTETVSQIVQKYAGSVVEFNGDGMMAVFGAPKELAHKERAAVEAGVEIVDAVGELEVEDARGGQTKLAVGVGIATGVAFVGNIQAVERMIWTAIGNTTNLAARLQSLTRELDASLVIDGSTWERAQPAAAGFEKRPNVPIRGRRETQDLYVLSMPAAA